MSRRKIPPPIPAYPAFLRDGRGPCASAPNLFTETGDRGDTRRRRVAKAKAICAECPFWSDCLTFALEYFQPGVYGGTTENDRAWILRRQSPQVAA